MGIDKELKEALGIEQHKPDDYRQKVSEAYKTKRNANFMKAAHKVNKKYPEIGAGLASIITAVFANRNLEDNLAKLSRNRTMQLNEYLINNIATYGKKRKMDAAQAVNDDSVMLQSIIAAYGSMDTYKQEFLEEVKVWNDRFTMLEKAASNPLFSAGMNLISKVTYKHKHQEIMDIYKQVNSFVKSANLTLEDAGSFGQNLVKEYAMINAREIKKYEKLYNTAKKAR